MHFYAICFGTLALTQASLEIWPLRWIKCAEVEDVCMLCCISCYDNKRNLQFNLQQQNLFSLSCDWATSLIIVYLVAPVGVGSQVGGIVLFFNGHQIVSWMWRRTEEAAMKAKILKCSVGFFSHSLSSSHCHHLKAFCSHMRDRKQIKWISVPRKTGKVSTYLAILDAPHAAHGGKAADEGAALHLQIVRLHLDSVQHRQSSRYFMLSLAKMYLF